MFCVHTNTNIPSHQLIHNQFKWPHLWTRLNDILPLPVDGGVVQCCVWQPALMNWMGSSQYSSNIGEGMDTRDCRDMRFVPRDRTRMTTPPSLLVHFSMPLNSLISSAPFIDPVCVKQHSFPAFCTPDMWYMQWPITDSSTPIQVISFFFTALVILWFSKIK